jgi:cystathionine beta-lyase/cystathionine gamma-synthase
MQGRPAQSERFIPRTRPVVPPIHQSVTYFLDDEAYKDVQAGGLDEIWYGRFRNPTVDVAAEEIRRLEGAEAAFMTASGMGAIATTLLTLLRGGDRIVAARQVYGDTRDLLVRDLPAWGFDVVQVDAMDLAAWRQAVDGRSPRLMYVETLANPQLDLADLPALADIAHAAGALLVVDNTFATPYSVQPLSLGADVVVHSATKFLNGHSDVIAGVVAGGHDLVREVQRRVITLGACLDPHAAYLVWRGLQTFELRLHRSNATARALATALALRDDVLAVRHPSLPGYERAEVADRVLRRDGDRLRAGGWCRSRWPGVTSAPCG